MSAPLRGEVWLADLNPTHGREQTGRRPVLVLSVDSFNQGPADLVIVLPITSRLRPIPSQIRLHPPEGGLRTVSAALCEAIRSISKSRLLHRLGRVSQDRIMLVEDRLRVLMGL